MCGINEGDIDTVVIPQVCMRSPHFGQYSRAITAGAIDGHPKLVTFYQPQLEQVLRQQLAYFPNVQMVLGAELLGFVETEDCVVVRVKLPHGSQRDTPTAYHGGAGYHHIRQRLADQYNLSNN